MGPPTSALFEIHFGNQYCGVRCRLCTSAAVKLLHFKLWAVRSGDVCIQQSDKALSNEGVQF